MDDPFFDGDNDDEEVEVSAEAYFNTAVAFEVALGILAVILGLWFGPQANLAVPEAHDWFGILWGLALGTLFAFPLVGIFRLIERFDLPQLEEINRFGREQVIPVMRRMTMLEIAVISLCAGVGEELLFRGWLQPMIAGDPTEATVESIAAGIGVAAIVFGLMHPVSVTYVVVVSLMGVVFGLMLVFTNNLLVPIAAHAVFDFIQLELAFREGEVDDEEDDSELENV